MGKHWLSTYNLKVVKKKFSRFHLNLVDTNNKYENKINSKNASDKQTYYLEASSRNKNNIKKGLF